MKKAFTLIELIATIVILGVVTSIVGILIMNVIRNVKDSANKRSIDNYGRIADTAMSEYQSQNLKYPTSFDELNIEYTGSKVECNISRINPDNTIYLSECEVNGKKVLDKKTEDGYYHYGTLVLTNEEYVDKLGNNIELALKDYYEENNKYPVNYRLLNLPKLDKEVNCVSDINPNGTVYLTKCSIDGEYVLDDTTEDGYYHYGELTAVKYLLKKTNPITVTNYIDGDIHEMYTFEHEATEQTPALTDYRYIGSNPNNYVEFNNELWRIIGVFKVEDENGNLEETVKIVRDESVSNKQWNLSNVNEWVGSTMQVYLNEEYYNLLNDNSKQLINASKYYLGGVPDRPISGSEYYNYERGSTVFNGHSLSWIGKISLINTSDYIYTYSLGVDNQCYSSGYTCKNSQNKMSSWLIKNDFYWMLNPYYQYNYISQLMSENVLYDNRNANGTVFNEWGVIPALYLLPNVKITSGDGTIDNAYKLSL